MTAFVEQRDRLSAAEQRAVADEVATWSARHEREALPEQSVFGLGEGSPICHLLGHDGDALIYLQGRPAEGTLEFVALGDRIPSLLLDAALECCDQAGLPLRVWTRHVDGLSQPPDCRCLLRLDREILRLSGPLIERPLSLPGGIEIASFRPGVDEGEWLALNQAAFAQHPEQGSLVLDDLELRIAQDWFDREGFLILRTGGQMVASCWTKVHRDPWGSIGEIYALGVHPTHVGRGLGRAAVVAGLEHLRGRGLERAMLYVEADNVAAVELYRSLGLVESWRDRRWTNELAR